MQRLYGDAGFGTESAIRGCRPRHGNRHTGMPASARKPPYGDAGLGTETAIRGCRLRMKTPPTASIRPIYPPRAYNGSKR
ncbi:MAG: hypothetical protein AAF752_07010 [Bacteroidota bacterium]